MKICVVGAGAIGGLLAAKLSRAGEQVTVIARGPHLAAIRAHGLKLVEEGGTETVAKLAATDKIAEAGPQDLVVLGMKAHQVAAVVGDLPALYRPDTMVLTAQNGIPWWYFFKHGGPYEGRQLESVDPGGVIAANLPLERVLACVVYPAAEIIAARRHQAHRGQPLLAVGDRQHSSTPRIKAGFGDADEGRLQGARRVRHPRRDLDEAVGQPQLQSGQRADPRDASKTSAAIR